MVRDTQFVAESLEEYADLLPPSEAATAATLRGAATIYRTLPTKRLVHLQEEDVDQAAARIVREATKD